MKKISAVISALVFSLAMVTSAYAVDVTLEWTHPTPEVVDGYKIYKGSASGVYDTPEDVGDTTTHTFNIPSTQHDFTVYFVATAYNQYGESGYSEEVNAVIEGAHAIPGLPSITKILQTYPDGKTVEVDFIDRTITTTESGGTPVVIPF